MPAFPAFFWGLPPKSMLPVFACRFLSCNNRLVASPYIDAALSLQSIFPFCTATGLAVLPPPNAATWWLRTELHPTIWLLFQATTAGVFEWRMDLGSRGQRR